MAVAVVADTCHEAGPYLHRYQLHLAYRPCCRRSQVANYHEEFAEAIVAQYDEATVEEDDVVVAVAVAVVAAAAEMASSVEEIVRDVGHLGIDAVGRAPAEPTATGPKGELGHSGSRTIRAAERVAGPAYTWKNAEGDESQVSWKAV